MKPAPFVYHAPESLDEVLALLAEHGSDARCMAGGQSLIPLMNLRMARPDVLIDLNRCTELMHIQRRDVAVDYGAMVRQRDAEHDAITRECCPLVAKALAHAGPVAVRSRATIGGTLAHADRAAELPGVAMALDATFVLASANGEREVGADEFFQGDMATAVEPDEMVKSVLFPIAAPGSYTQFFDVGVRREGVAIIGLAAQIRFGDDAVIDEARFAVIGVEPAPVRLRDVEALLTGQKIENEIVDASADLATTLVDPLDDPYVKARYRRLVTGSLVKKALEGALAYRRH